MKTYHIQYKKYTDSNWATCSTEASSNAEAYDNFYKEVGRAYAYRLTDVTDDSIIDDSSQYDPIPPVIFIILFVIIMHLILR